MYRIRVQAALYPEKRVLKPVQFHTRDATEAAALLSCLCSPLDSDPASLSAWEGLHYLKVEGGHATLHVLRSYVSPGLSAHGRSSDLRARHRLLWLAGGTSMPSLVNLTVSDVEAMAVPTVLDHELEQEAKDQWAKQERLRTCGVITLHHVIPEVQRTKILQAREGSQSYQRDPWAEKLPFVRCKGQVGAYSAAWLLGAWTFHSVNFKPRLTLEWPSFNVFQSAAHNGGAALKTADFRDFYVNHLSHFDKTAERHGDYSTIVVRFARAAEQECHLLTPISHVYQHHPAPGANEPDPSVLGLVPFWGGEAEASGGNAHSHSPRQIKEWQMAGTVCSLLRYFTRTVVGVCMPSDRDSVLSMAKKWNLPVTVKRFESLPFEEAVAKYPTSELMAHFKAHKVPLARDTPRHTLVDMLRGSELGSKLAKKFPPTPSVTLTSTDSLPRIVIYHFDCALGVHLPYHLLEAVQVRCSSQVAPHRTTRPPPPLSLSPFGFLPHSQEQDDTTEDHLYFSESDQILHIRDPNWVLPQLKAGLGNWTYIAPQRSLMRKDTVNFMLKNHPSLEDPTSLSELLLNSNSTTSKDVSEEAKFLTLENNC